MIGKKRNILLICFLSVSIIAILIFVGKLNAGKEIRSEQSTMKAAAVEQVHREVKERDIQKASVTEEQPEGKDEQKTYTNIETSNDYVNFERLIMQISEYTTPDEIGNEEE